MKTYLLLFLITISAINAQETQKTFRYAIVPVQYNFLSEPNQFQLNVLTRVYLKDSGFSVYMNEGEAMPQELAENQCLALKANVVKEKGLFTSNLLFQLKNCYGNVVFESRGSSRKKAYKDAYKEALSIALDEFLLVSGGYVMKSKSIEETSIPTDVSFEKDIEDNRPFSEKAENYLLDSKTMWLLKQGENYILYEDEGETVFATLDQADRGTFAYDSELIDGAAYFNSDGDLIVEYLAKGEVEVQKLIIKKQ